MLFKNYRNKYNRRRQIYSYEDMMMKSLNDIFENENDYLAQYNTIGIPRNSELEASVNTQWVEPFTNEAGESDGGYWESISTPTKQYTNPMVSSLSEQKPLTIVGEHQFNPMMKDFNQDLQENQEETPLLTGGVEMNVDRKKSKKEKYENLTLTESIAKAVSKIQLPWTSQQYYGHAMHLADGEEPSNYMKKNNDLYRYGDLPDSEQKDFYRKQAAKLYGLDINDPNLDEKIKDAPIVISKPDSPLSKKVKNSEAFKDFVVEHYDDIKANRDANGSVVFPADSNFDLYATIHKADATIPADSDKGRTNDLYNFEKWKTVPLLQGVDSGNNVVDSLSNIGKNTKTIGENMLNNAKAKLNNLGFQQQRKGQLADYILTSDMDLTSEEIEKILEEYLKKKNK